MQEVGKLLPTMPGSVKRSEPLTDDERLELARAKADRYNATRGDLPDYDCPECMNRGDFAKVFRDDKWGMIREVVQPCRCVKVRKAIWRMRASGLESIIRRCRFDNFEVKAPWQENLVKLCKDYAANPTGWLFLGGQVGCGKTHLCTAVCRELLHRGIPVVYMPWQTAIAALKANAMEAEEYETQMKTYKTADVLYIDDFFKPALGQDPTPADIRTAYDLINYRYINRLPTIISSERNAMELVQIDEATGSRVYEMSKSHNMNIKRSPDRDYRIQGATEQ